jgi:hypothetical protein
VKYPSKFATTNMSMDALKNSRNRRRLSFKWRSWCSMRRAATAPAPMSALSVSTVKTTIRSTPTSGPNRPACSPAYRSKPTTIVSNSAAGSSRFNSSPLEREEESDCVIA